MSRSSSRSKTKKPPELKEDSFEDAPTKEFVRALKKITNGRLYVYKWNQKSDASPLCIYMESDDVERVSNTLENIGAPKSNLVNSGTKFDLSTITGFPGSHFELWSSGRAKVNWPKSSSGPDFKGSFLDVVTAISKNLGWCKDDNDEDDDGDENGVDEEDGDKDDDNEDGNGKKNNQQQQQQ